MKPNPDPDVPRTPVPSRPGPISDPDGGERETAPTPRRRARLLVSVRSVDEALAAVEGGADLVDVKEPARGPLGRADLSTWRAIRAALPPRVPLSVALGELPEWAPDPRAAARRLGLDRPEAWAGVAFAKVGPAGAAVDSPPRRRALRRAVFQNANACGEPRPETDPRTGTGTRPVAVLYADHAPADAPEPDELLREAVEDRPFGVLVDTWRKSPSADPWWRDPAWDRRVRAIRANGLALALAGSLDEPAIVAIARLGWRPDWIAVRGAVCAGGRREGPVDPDRVARLVRSLEVFEDQPDPEPDPRPDRPPLPGQPFEDFGGGPARIGSNRLPSNRT